MSLELDFQKVVHEYSDLIDAKIAQSHKLLEEAVAIAEEHGIPFYSSISPLSQQYQPESFQKKWGNIDEEFLEEMNIYPSEYEGWAHSAVCKLCQI